MMTPDRFPGAFQGNRAGEQVRVPPSVPLSGRVLNEQGTGLPGAEITACENDWTGNCPAPIRDTSKSDGSYQLVLPFAGDARWNVKVAKAGFFPSQAIVHATARGLAEHDFVLREGSASIRGKVLRPDRRPLPGAEVEVTISESGAERTNRSRSVSALSTSLTAVSGADGSFSFTGLPATGADITASASGYELADTWIELRPDDNSVQIVMTSTRVLSFRVLTPQGEGIPDSVAVCSNPRDGRGLLFSSDKDGTAHVTVPADLEAFACQVSAPGYRVRHVDVNTAAPPREVVLVEGCLVRGRVVDEDNGRGLSRVKVQAIGYREAGRESGRSASSVTEAAAESDELGQFQFIVSSETNLQIMASAKGYANKQLWVDPRDDELGITIGMKRADCSLHGRVIDRDGNPVASFSVGIREAGSAATPSDPSSIVAGMRAGAGWSTVKTFEDPLGFFEFLELPAGNLQVQVQTQEQNPLVKTVTVRTARGRATEIVVQLDRRPH